MNVKRLLALPVAALVLSGCSGLNFSIDDLLAAPKLTEEQTQIHEALISAVGRGITLKYPRSGSNRSAYVIADIDGEPTEEALVFYEYSSAESDGIRMNLLDKNEEGEWYSVKELAGAGTEIDQVIISPMSKDGEMDILVGYQNPAGENNLEIYTYSAKGFQRIGTDSYSLLEAIDIDSDGTDELITVQKNADPETGAVTSRAYLLSVADGEIIKDDGTELCDGVTSYVRAFSGILSNGDPAVYIDEINSDGMLRTEIIFYRYSGLQAPVKLRSEKMLPLCTRPVGYSCADLDNDGVYEIPSAKPMLGYENAVAEEQVFRTTWSQYKDFYELEQKLSGYYNVTEGYMMAFPSRWNDAVTVKPDNETEETVFYKYAGDINAQMTELMRIKTVTKNESEEYLYDGYTLIASRGQIDYLVKLPTNMREQMILTIDEVQNNFYPLNY